MRTHVVFAVAACMGLAGASDPAFAQGGFSIDVNGQHVRIGVPKDCNDEHCVTITTGKPGGRNGQGDEQTIDGSQLLDMFSGMMRDDDPAPHRPSRPAAKRPDRAPGTSPDAGGPVATLPPASVRPDPAEAPRLNAPRPAASPVAVPPVVAMPSTATPSGATPSTATPGGRTPTSAQPVAQPTAMPANPPTTAPAAPPAPLPPQVAAIPPAQPPLAAVPPDPTSPAGLWLTENSEGRIRIAPCGANLCGFAVETGSDRDGTKILIDMRPIRDGVWKGRVRDPRGGGLYDATMTLKAPDRLGIRGCAMGGLICQGQTWTRG